MIKEDDLIDLHCSEFTIIMWSCDVCKSCRMFSSHLCVFASNSSAWNFWAFYLHENMVCTQVNLGAYEKVSIGWPAGPHLITGWAKLATGTSGWICVCVCVYVRCCPEKSGDITCYRQQYWRRNEDVAKIRQRSRRWSSSALWKGYAERLKTWTMDLLLLLL